MTTATHKIRGNTSNLERVREIFVMSSRIADDTESVLEDNIMFSTEFMRGLNTSLEDARKGKVRKVGSLRDISPR